MKYTMPVLKFTRKGNALNRLSISKLEEDRVLLRNQLDRSRRDLEQIEKKKKQLFSSGVGADFLTKKLIMQELKQLDQSGRMKINEINSVFKKYTFTDNVLSLKRFEKELKKTEMWNRLEGITADELEKSLVQCSLGGKKLNSVLDDLNRIFNVEITAEASDLDEEEKKLLEIWTEVEAGELEAESAEKKLSLDAELERTLAAAV